VQPATFVRFAFPLLFVYISNDIAPLITQRLLTQQGHSDSALNQPKQQLP
jgi:hypothetical protein